MVNRRCWSASFHSETSSRRGALHADACYETVVEESLDAAELTLGAEGDAVIFLLHGSAEDCLEPALGDFRGSLELGSVGILEIIVSTLDVAVGGASRDSVFLVVVGDDLVAGAAFLHELHDDVDAVLECGGRDPVTTGSGGLSGEF